MADVEPVKEQLAQSLFDHIPVGVGSKGVIPTTMNDLESALEMGMDWSIREGYAWAEDKEHCEEFGRMLQVCLELLRSLLWAYPIPWIRLIPIWLVREQRNGDYRN